MEQVTLNFDASPFDSYGTCREFIQRQVHTRGVPQKAIAADMDMGSSQLSRKLTQAPGDSARWTQDDTETYIEKTGDIEPIHYLVHKHIIKKSRNREALLKLREEIERQLQEG